MTVKTGTTNHKIILLAVVVLAIALRLTAFNGFGAVDDAEYARFANEISEGRFPVEDYSGPIVFPLRLGIVFPTAVLFKLFGVHEWTMVGFPFIISILGVLMAYWGARLFFGATAGLVGAVLWAILPVDSFHASLLTPDPSGAFFAGCGVLLLLHALRANPEKAKHQHLYSLGSGLLFGYSWLCKSSLVYLFPFILVLCVTSLKGDTKRGLKIWVLATAGFMAIIIGEYLFYLIVTGDGFYRIQALQRNAAENPAAFDAAMVGNLKAVVKRIVLTGPLTMLINPQFLFLPFIALLGGVHALYWKDRAFLLPVAWIVILMLIFNFGTISFKHYQPLLLFERYLYPLFLPAVIVASGFISNLLIRPSGQTAPQEKETARERNFWAALLIAVLAIVAVHNNYKNMNWNPTWTTAVKRVSREIHPNNKMYTDILSIHGLEFFWQYPEGLDCTELKNLDDLSGMPSDSYILVNQTYLDWLKRKKGWWPNLDHRAHEFGFDRKELEKLDLVLKEGDAILYKK